MGYKPQARRAGQTYYLPLPCMKTSESFTRRVGTSEIPLQPGVLVSTSTRGALSVSFSGKAVIGNPQDEDIITDLTEAHEEMVDFFVNNDQPFTLYRFVAGAMIGGKVYGQDTKSYYYRNVYCQSLNFDFTNRDNGSFDYSLSIIVPDGIEWRS